MPAGAQPHDDAQSLGPLEFARIAADVLGASPYPALVLEVPSERIVASSPAAARLVNPGGRTIIGRLLEDFTADRPAPGGDLFAGGRLNGFETFRVLRRESGGNVKVRMWIRSFGGQPSSQLVLVLIVPDKHPDDVTDEAESEDAPAVVGMADATLLIERISSDAEDLFKQPVERMLGRSLIGLVVSDDVPAFLAALGEASGGHSGITLYLDIRTGVEGSAIRCEVLLLPLQPSPSCAFVFLPMPAGTGEPHIYSDLSALLLRLGRGAEVAQLVRGVFRGITEQTVPGINRLTTRELEVVTRLLEGDRAPAIARKLFLSQSTVRNHLASVFGKLGITSQQELLDIVRRAQVDLG